MSLAGILAPGPKMGKGVPPARAGAIVRSVTLSSDSTEPRAAELDAARAKEREEERALCDRAKGGDREALARLLRRHGPTLYRTVLLPRLGSEAAAQDALADTYMRVLERFDQFEWRGCGVYPWLRVIAMRIALDALRAKKRETLFEPSDLSRAVDEAETDLEQGADEQLCERRDRDAAKKRLDEALGAINQRYARAIRLRVLEERSREDAALELGVTVPTFDVVLHRALSALRKALRPEEALP
jgi:RNA polymerase sigma-70 factor (ECF subfamily)